MKKIGIITQARLGSSRLPGKIFKKIGDKTLLDFHIDRLKKTEFNVYVATTVEPLDDQVENFCNQIGVPCFRGSETNVLSRFLKVIESEKLDIVVRVTSDCPLIDPNLISNGISIYLKNDNDRVYMANTIERSYARGFDFEIFSANLLRESNQKDQSLRNQEHVTPYLYSGVDPTVVMHSLHQSEDHSFLRVTVDEPSDFILIEKLITEYSAEKLSAAEIEKILIENPRLQLINKNIVQKKI